MTAAVAIPQYVTVRVGGHGEAAGRAVEVHSVEVSVEGHRGSTGSLLPQPSRSPPRGPPESDSRKLGLAHGIGNLLSLVPDSAPGDPTGQSVGSSSAATGAGRILKSAFRLRNKRGR